MKVPQRVSELQTQTAGLTLQWSQFTKGHKSIKTVDGVMVLSAHLLMMLYICTKFQEISKRVSKLLSGHDLHTVIYKGA